MRSASLHDAEFRNGDWGPAYLMQAENFAMGVVRLRCGDSIENHDHHTCDESFVVLEGTGTPWVDVETSHTLEEGDVYSCAPGEMRYFVGEGDDAFSFVSIKSPTSSGDTVTLPCEPGQQKPVVPPADAATSD
jgi:quercetin dioxygenase-like cupin family protein